MALTLLDETKTRTITDAALIPLDGDPDVTYTVRALTRGKLATLRAAAVTKTLNERTRAMEDRFDPELFNTKALEYVLVSWTGWEHRGAVVAPGDLVDGTIARDLLDTVRRDALLVFAMRNSASEVRETAESFRPAADLQ